MLFSYLVSLARQGVEHVQSFSYSQLDPTLKHISMNIDTLWIVVTNATLKALLSKRAITL